MKPRIFYLCYDHQHPSGGQKHTYQHVDVLRRNGFDAYAVHQQPGFRLQWFANETCVIDRARCLASMQPARDFIVFPEDWPIGDDEIGGHKVIFNKNVFYGFAHLGLGRPRVDPYRRSDVVAAFAVSAHNARQLRYAYPGLEVHEVVMDLREHVFTFVPLADKSRLIAAVPKTRSIASVYQMSRSRADAGLMPGGDCEWIFLRDRTEEDVARVLARSLIFVFLSAEEGLGRMPLEALLSGCVVVTYANGPLREMLPAAFHCDYADPVSAVRAIETALEAWPDRLAHLQAQVMAARAVALGYSSDAQARSVCAAWERIFCHVFKGHRHECD